MGNSSSSKKKAAAAEKKRVAERKATLAKHTPQENPFPRKKQSVVPAKQKKPTKPASKQVDPRQLDFDNLVQRLTEFYRRYDPVNLDTGSVNPEEIAEWALTEENGFDQLYEELSTRFGVNLDEFMEIDPEWREYVEQIHEDLDEVPPPPPLTPKSEMVVEEKDRERRISALRRSFLLDGTEVRDMFSGYHDENKDDDDDDDFAETTTPSDKQVDAIRTHLERFFLMHDPSIPLEEIEDFVDSYAKFGLVPLDSDLLSKYGSNITAMLESERAASSAAPMRAPPRRKPSYQENFGVQVHPSAVLREVAKPRRLTATLPSQPAVRKESMVSGSLERKWRQRKESTTAAGERTSLKRKSTTFVCPGFELDVAATEFGACIHCGQKKLEHSGEKGPAISSSLQRRWKNQQ